MGYWNRRILRNGFFIVALLTTPMGCGDDETTDIGSQVSVESSREIAVPGSDSPMGQDGTQAPLPVIEPDNADELREAQSQNEQSGEVSSPVRDVSQEPQNEESGFAAGSDDPGPGTTLTCGEIFDCFTRCRQGDRACTDACMEQGNRTAQAQVQAIGDCLTQNNCQDDACVNERCASQVEACHNDGAPPSSPEPPAGPPNPGVGPNGLSCVDVFNCFRACPSGNRACTDGCFQQGSAVGQIQVQAVGDCIQVHQCADDACVERACGPELRSCGFAPPAGNQGRAGPVELCGDGIDNDGDGQLDCDDTDCRVSAQCVAPGGPAAAGTCQEPRVVHWGEHNGTTQGAPARESGSCAGQGGERVYVLRLDTASTVCVDTFQSNFDTAIYVRRDQCASPQAELICNDDMRGVQSELEFRAEAGVDYYIFVDGYQAPGDFVLNLRQGGCHDLPGR